MNFIWFQRKWGNIVQSLQIINPNLGVGCGGVYLHLPPCLYSLNNSETIKAVTLALWSIRDIFSKLGINNSPQSLAISNSWISGQSLMNKHWHNSRTSNNIDMKLGPVTKLDKRNTATSKKFDDVAMSANCDKIVIFSIYGGFGAILKPDSGLMACNSYIFVISNLFLYKSWKQN